MVVQISSTSEAIAARLVRQQARLQRELEWRVNLAVNRRALAGFVPADTGRLRRSMRVKQYRRRGGLQRWKISLGNRRTPYLRYTRLRRRRRGRDYGEPFRGMPRLLRDRVKAHLRGWRVTLR